MKDLYNVMTGILDQLATEEPSDWSSVDSYRKSREEQRLVQFLMALRDEFEPLRGDILLRSPLPTVNEAVSELIAEETRLKSPMFSVTQTQSVFAAAPQSQFSYMPQTPRSRQKVNIYECSYCHEKGHWKKDCPRLNKDKVRPNPSRGPPKDRASSRSTRKNAAFPD